MPLYERPKKKSWNWFWWVLALAVGGIDWVLVHKPEAPAAPASGPAQITDQAGSRPGFPPASNPRFRQVMLRTKHERALTLHAAGKKTLTSDQSRAILESLQDLTLKVRAEVKDQPGQELTEEQQAELNQELDGNSKALGEAEPPSAGAP